MEPVLNFLLVFGLMGFASAIIPFLTDRDEKQRGGPKWEPRVGGGAAIFYSIGWRRLVGYGIASSAIGGLGILIFY